MTRVAAVDCGTNSIRLLIADVDADGSLTDVTREMRIVRLGQGVDRTGKFAPEALERTRAALHDYARLIEHHDTEQVRMVATSATRDVSNREDFIEMVRAELGVDPDVITGNEEAALSFVGAASVLPESTGDLLVADIGGGSTELVRGEAGVPGGGNLRSHSMDVGCVRMAERHLHDDPPTAAQVDAVVADVRAAVEQAQVDVPLDGPVTFVGVAGTVTTLAGIVLDLPEYDPAAIHGAVLTANQVHDVATRLLSMGHDERAALPVMHPGRVDVITGGALVLRTLVEEIGADTVIASEHDILDGIALGLSKARLARD